MSGLHQPQRLLDSVSAASNQASAAQATDAYPRLSVHIIWSSLTGTVDGTVKLQVSNTGGDWVDKTGASVTLSGASGADMISLNGVCTEFYYRVVYTKNNITGGTISAVVAAKAA
jgi:hypothetical protein